MNERIKELLEEATEVYDHWHSGESHSVVDYKVFAELIVKECVSQCEQVAVHADKMTKSAFVTDAGRQLYQGMWGGAKNCSTQIKEHFGVQDRE